ncbi:ABC transporter substrate-binding protein [Bacillus sp. REN16]|uniref:ABC transporter substrate-binding protein n=1 Tax=Bacillus sp. REN16 TaxID=2887296 RepID=UPI001E290628|nr:sugar ABC transporter substrate-binding protein [Bacillus sp. REN16]MCC3355341.1 sugar ABC transporter substrate-binding protein [Bacillus sp. REN16]
MKKVFSYLIFIALVLFLAACGDSASGDGEKTDDSSSKKESGEVALKVAVFPADLPTFESAYEKFKEENPDIKVEFETFPQEQYYEKIRMQLSGGIGYDVFAGQIDTMMDTGIIEPLDSYIEKSDLDVAGFASMYDAMKYDEGVLGLPYRKSNNMMFYNKDLFDQAGVEYPSEDMTWEEFREVAKKLTSGSGADKTYGAYIQQWPQLWYMQGVQTGASIIDKDLSIFEDSLQYRMDLEKDGSIMSWSEQVSTGAHYNAAFQKGNVAMNIIGDWHVAQLRQAEEEGKLSFDWDVVPVPHPEGVEANTTLALPVSLMLNSKSENKDAAFTFLSYMTGKQGAEIFAGDGYLTGYVDEDVKSIYLGDGSLKPVNAHYFLETTEYPEYPMYVGVKNIVVQQIYKQEGELALIGEQTADEAIKNIAKRVQDEWASKYADK